jgi:hypothetical protein
MHDYDNAPPVRPQVLVPQHLGMRGWEQLHLLADLHGRAPRLEVLALLRWALWRSLAGDNPELTAAQFSSLRGSADDGALEPLAEAS